ncbi:HD-GYP domain-containing protein [Heliorestis convoluta]|uniref:HD domain protein n=1 Tax=Heliorestis convoluta TaxID=356322 RepID=A0A5Q2MYU5_9FIRM|nr:HD domain-containing phosphohydrolase [Heliorestis convoluta]QGG47161.1 Putative HD domain protein [Heliorestis convoluta]
MSTCILTEQQYKEMVSKTHQLLSALYNYHSPIYHHSLQVGKVTQSFLRYLNWSSQDIIIGTTAALLHDIGKMRVEKELWSKEQGITILEYIQMEVHASHSQNILTEAAVFPAIIIESVAQHHERENGAGYPNKINKMTPLASIIAIVNDYTALQEIRPGHPVRSSFQALTHMLEQENHYDRVLFRAWQNYLVLQGITSQPIETKPITSLTA